MIVSRTHKPELRTCAGCGKDHPTTLFNAQGFCVYCAAAKVLEQTPEKYAAKAQTDEQRALAEKRRLHLEIQSKKRRALKKVKEESERKQSAKQELARRELARNHLLPFILRFNESYEAGCFNPLQSGAGLGL